MKVLEDCLKTSSRSGMRSIANGLSRSRSVNGAEYSSSPANVLVTRKPLDPVQRSSMLPSPSSVMLKHAKGASRSFDGGRTSSDENQCRAKSFGDDCSGDPLKDDKVGLSINDGSIESVEETLIDGKPRDHVETASDESVSGVFYDILQKEVIALRKACHEREQNLKDKDSSIEVGILSFFLILHKAHFLLFNKN